MADILEILEGGELRRLGTLQPKTATPDTHATVFGDTPNTTLIPRAQWKPVSFRQFFPRIKNQGPIGMCNCSATGNVTEGCRRMAGGLADVDLSAGDLYRRISGGSDNGSLPEDALKEMMTHGMAPVADVPYLDWHRNTAGGDADRGKYRITEALWCPTFDHVASASQQGFLIDVAVWWYGRDPVDADGWLGGGSGSRGGHAICGCGLANRNGQWGIVFVNSWGPTWGQNGFAVLPEARVAAGCSAFQVWAVRAVLQESGNFPAPVEP